MQNRYNPEIKSGKKIGVDCNTKVLKDNQKFQLFQEGDIGAIAQESNKRCIVLLFGADWLGSSYILERFLVEEGSVYPEVTFYKVDIDKNPLLMERMDIKQVPATFFFAGGEIVAFLEGLASRTKVRQKFAQSIKGKT